MKSSFVLEIFRHRPVYFFYGAVILTIILLGINLGFIILIDDPQLRSTLSDIISPVVDLAASVALFIAAKKSATRSKRLAIAWGSIALAMFLYFLGDITWFILEVYLKVPPFPSFADGFYLAYYPAFLLGAFLLTERPTTLGELVKRTLDMTIILGSAFLIFWNLLIGPSMGSTTGQTLLEQGALVAYPIGDLVLFGALLLIVYYPSEKQEIAPIYLMVISLLIMIIADVLFSYQSLSGTYVSGGLLDLSWIVGVQFVGLAGITQLVTIRTTNTIRNRRLLDAFQDRLKASQSYVPYLWVVMVFISLGPPHEGASSSIGTFPISFGVAGIIFLVIVRQIIAISENNKLNARLQISLERIQIQAVELEKRNLELQNDITKRRLAEEALQVSGTQLSEALKIARMAYWEYDVILDQFTFNDQFYSLFRTTAEQEGGYTMSSARFVERFVHPEDAAVVGREVQKAIETSDPEYQIQLDHRILRAGDETGYLSVNIRTEKDAQGRTVKARGVNQDITERKEAEIARQQSETLFRTLFELSPDAIILIDPNDPNVSWPIVDCNTAACRMNGYTRDELIGQSIDVVNSTPPIPSKQNDYLKQLREEGTLKYVASHRRKDGTVFLVDVFTTLFKVGERELIVGIDHDITERNRNEEEIKHRLAELEAIDKISSTLRAAKTLEEMLPTLLDTTLDVMQAEQGSIWLYDSSKDELEAVITRGYDKQAGTSPLLPVKPGKGIAGRVFASGKPYVANNFRLNPQLSKATRELIPPDIGGAAIPIRTEQNIIGTLIINIPLPRVLRPDEVRLLTTLSEIAGVGIRREALRKQTERRLRQLTALSEIDRSISSSFDLRLTLTTLLAQVITQLDIDAVDILLFDPTLRTLDYAAGRGFRTRSFEHAHLRLGEGYAGRAAQERKIIHIANLPEQNDNPRLAKVMAKGEGFVSYFGVPLLAKGQIKGVLEVFHRVPIEHDTEWLDFLETLASQAAIAIDNATLFENMQRSNLDLAMAYDATIEGWSRALDLRDEETEGHTQRVTQMTISLARVFNLSEEELAQVRWGALLHDIGKMGIPDRILLKPGPLTDEEWVIMRKHPVFAYEMLSPIEYLRSALDIPHFHHEKWDGTGYPLGLKGEQIPLTARIFAVVDVWDALRSDRPYRDAWPEEKVRKHILSLSGTHFDPQVVKAFFESVIPEWEV